jgi:hypothetical protein
MATAKKAKKTARGRKQDRARVAGGQNYEVRYEAKKTGRLGVRREEGCQEGRQLPKARGKATWTLTEGQTLSTWPRNLAEPGAFGRRC